LSTVPPEILEHIALYLGIEHTPSLVNLFVTAPVFNQALSPAKNPALYARLFKRRFDVAAIRRRFGNSITARHFCDEYRKRLETLSRIRRLVQAGQLAEQEQLEKDLWLVYLMLLEHGTCICLARTEVENNSS
jgi:hypothetical protein